MANIPSTFYPTVSPDIPWETRKHLQLIYQKLGNHALAFAQVGTLAGTTTNNTIENFGGGSGTGGSPITGLGGVNDQTGNTVYTTTVADNGVLLVLDDASPVAVTLTTGISSPWFIFSTNLGSGIVTFTPMTGTVNGGATFTLPFNYSSVIFYDGTNFFATALPIVPQNTPAITHEWINAYNSTTGIFSQTRPDYSDLTGTPLLPNTATPIAGEYLTGYNAATGNFSLSTPAGISVTITTAALTVGGTQGSQTFVGGILTAQVQAT